MKTELVAANENEVSVVLVDDGIESNVVTLSYDFYRTLKKMLELKLSFEAALGSDEFSELEHSRIGKIKDQVRFAREKTEKSPRDIAMFEVNSRVNFIKNHMPMDEKQTLDYVQVLGEAEGMTRLAQCLGIFDEMDVTAITAAARGVSETMH